MNRRDFIKKTVLGVGVLSLAPATIFASIEPEPALIPFDMVVPNFDLLASDFDGDTLNIIPIGNLNRNPSLAKITTARTPGKSVSPYDLDKFIKEHTRYLDNRQT